MTASEPIASFRTPALFIWTAAGAGALLAGPILFAELVFELPPEHELGRLVFIVAGLAAIVYAYIDSKTRTFVFADRIEQTSMFSRRSLAVDDIAGFRGTRLIAKTAQMKSIRVPGEVFDCADRAPWIGALVDLHKTDLDSLDVAARKNERFGATVGERAIFARRMKNAVGPLTFVGIAVAAWGVIWPEPRPLAIGLLILVPLLSVAFAVWARPIIRVDDDRSPSRPDLASALFFPTLALMFVSRFDDIVDPPPKLAIVAAGIGIAALLAWADPMLRRRWVMLVVIAGMAAIFIGNAGLELNLLLDRAQPQHRGAVLDEKRITGKSGDNHYELVIRPWFDGAVERAVEVKKDLYDTVAVGDRICITLHPGALGWRWYEVARCT